MPRKTGIKKSKLGHRMEDKKKKEKGKQSVQRGERMWEARGRERVTEMWEKKGVAPSFRRMADVHFGMILLTFGVGSINWLSFSRFT